MAKKKKIPALPIKLTPELIRQLPEPDGDRTGLGMPEVSAPPPVTPPPLPVALDLRRTPDEELFGKDYVAKSHAARVRVLTYELAKRKVEALRLYEPMPLQQEFHSSRATYRLIRGSNRAGKTLGAAAEVARAVTGQDPYQKYPTRDGMAFLVGKDSKHLGKVMYRKLFRPGAFRVIRDFETGRWRAYRPWSTHDTERVVESRPVPPLVPERMLVDVAWENKKENIPALIRLSNGWELYFFSSLGKPPQGDPIDLFWLDEEIVDPAWYPELSARVVDRQGRGIWSATPQAGTDQLFELHERCEVERSKPDGQRRYEEFVALLEHNRHIDDQSKRDFAADLSEDEARVRVGGEFALLSYKVYPNFSMLVHGHPTMQVPDHWTRYAYIDPGHRVCAVLFGAVPPPQEQDIVLLYQELYIKESNADVFAEAMERACRDQVMQAFLIDYHMAIHTEAGMGRNVMQQYSEALAKRRVRSVSTGFGFLPAHDDVQAGVMAVNGMLRVRDHEVGPKLRVMQGRLPMFEWEIHRYHRKRINGVVQEQPDQRKDNHLMDCLRYMALHNPPYVHRRQPAANVSPALQSFRAKLQRRNARDGSGVVNLGPRGGAF